MIWQKWQQLSCTSFKIKVSHQKSIYNYVFCWCRFFGCKQSATHSERSRNPLLGCIPSTFDRPVEKHCNRLCLTHRRVTIGSTQRSIEILNYIKKKTCAGIGLDRYRPILRICGIGSVLKKWYRCIPSVNVCIFWNIPVAAEKASIAAHVETIVASTVYLLYF